MTAREAVEKYVRGFYFRPDEEDRDWEKYGTEDLSFHQPVWEEAEKHGVEFIAVDHVYAPDLSCVAVVLVKWPTEVDPFELRTLWQSNEGWVRDLMGSLANEEQGNDVHLMYSWCSPQVDVFRFVVNESC